MDLIRTLEQEEIKRLKKDVPDFSPGDTVIVNVNVVEGERKRSQAFEGMVIAKRKRRGCRPDGKLLGSRRLGWSGRVLKPFRECGVSFGLGREGD